MRDSTVSLTGELVTASFHAHRRVVNSGNGTPMNVAIVLGWGPDVDYLLACPELLPNDAVLFKTNVSGPLKFRKTPQLPTLNIFDLQKTKQILEQHRVSRIVTIGSMKVAAPSLRTLASVHRLSAYLRTVGRGGDSSDVTRAELIAKLQRWFEFPPVKAVLPSIFAHEDIAINPSTEIRDAALRDPASYTKDARVKVGDETVVVFRVQGDQSSNLVNRRMYPEKLLSINRDESITRFFFDRNRTIVVGILEIVRYATSNGWTLQSFVETPSVASHNEK